MLAPQERQYLNKDCSMENYLFKLTDFQPILLGEEDIKYWKIMIDDQIKTSSCCDSLLGKKREGETRQISSQKKHLYLREAIDYMEYHIGAELEKGCRFLNTKSEYGSLDLRNDFGKIKEIVYHKTDSDSDSDVNLESDSVIEEEHSIMMIERTPGSRFELKVPEYTETNSLENSQVFNTEEKRNIDLDFFEGVYLIKNNDEEECSSKKKQSFFKIQMLDACLKIESGFENDHLHKTEYRQFSDIQAAKAEILEIIFQQLLDGYSYASDKFVLDFDKHEMENKLESEPKSNLDSESDSKINHSERSSFESKEIIRELPSLLSWEGQDIMNWYMAEKVIGIRCCWTGSQLVSQQGYIYRPPKEFIRAFPKLPLEGIIFPGRGKIIHASNAILRRSNRSTCWNSLQFVVYDMPSKSLTFRERLNTLNTQFAGIDSNSIRLADYVQISDKIQVPRFKQKLTALNGEGIIFKEPNAFYDQKLKAHMELNLLKPEKGTVLRINFTSKTQRKIKSITVENLVTLKQVEISKGFPLSMLKDPPKAGTVISYQHSARKRNADSRSVVFVGIDQ